MGSNPKTVRGNGGTIVVQARSKFGFLSESGDIPRDAMRGQSTHDVCKIVRISEPIAFGDRTHHHRIKLSLQPLKMLDNGLNSYTAGFADKEVIKLSL